MLIQSVFYDGSEVKKVKKNWLKKKICDELISKIVVLKAWYCCLVGEIAPERIARIFLRCLI